MSNQKGQNPQNPQGQPNRPNPQAIQGQQQGQQKGQQKGRRVSVDCRQSPKAQGCTLEVSGSEQEVLEILVPHVARRHNMQDTPETREQIRAMFQETH